MIKARVIYPNGQTIMRQGTAILDACIAQGCYIVPDPANMLPPGRYDNAMYVPEDDKQQEPSTTTSPQVEEPKRKRGRPRIHERR